MSTIHVIKRNGDRVPYDEEFIHKIVWMACDDLDGVSVSDIVLHAGIQIYDGIKTAQIHDMLIKSAADKISVETPNYQYVAARLNMYKIRKIAYGRWDPPSLLDHLNNMVSGGWYDPDILTHYTEEEINSFDKCIDHNLDMSFSYAATKQFTGKYLVQNRITRNVVESPQMSLMCIAMSIFGNFSYDREQRNVLVKDMYYHLSRNDISLPTPIMSGVRTPMKQFSSCVLIECDDSLDSIAAVGSAIIKYVSQKAGIGINVGKIRAKGTPVRGGTVYHTGITPFIKYFQSAVQSCSAGGIRVGAATIYFPIWHYEIEDMIVLRNNRGIEENRARHLDYAVQINGYLYKKLQRDENIVLFSPHEVRDLYEAFFSDQDKFEWLYEKYSCDDNIKYKKTIKAIDLFSLLIMERSSTGRIYIMNTDHCNTHSSFLTNIAPIRQSNLCTEITLPTRAIRDEDHNAGEIALCILGAVNVGNIGLDHAKMRKCTKLLVYALDSIIDIQSYPVKASENGTKDRRSLGIGVINYASFLAMHNTSFSDNQKLNLTHELFESLQYYCIDASVELAKIKGPCARFNETKYSQGILPIDTYYNKTIDKLVPNDLKLDWELLRSKVKQYGMRNSTLTSLMPSETSSQISNSTNGIEPPRALISVKQSKDGILKQVVPNIDKHKYELLWDMKNNDGYLIKVGIMQKFVDQAISTNTNYDPEKYQGGKVPMQALLRDMLFAYSLGIKTLYYHNTRDHSGKSDISGCDDSGCSGGACKI